MPMSPRKILYAMLGLAPILTAGQTPDLPPQSEQPLPGGAPRPAVGRPVAQTSVSGQSELQSFLDPQSEMDRRRMLDKQQRTFQLEIDGRYAKALKAYCDTGFGDDRCLRPDASRQLSAIAPLPAPVVSIGAAQPSPAKSHNSPTEHELPAVAQISGFGDDLSAVLVFASGKRLRVLGPGPNGPRSQLPDGERIVGIRPGEVLVARSGDGAPVPLLFLPAAGFSGTD